MAFSEQAVYVNVDQTQLLIDFAPAGWRVKLVKMAEMGKSLKES